MSAAYWKLQVAGDAEFERLGEAVRALAVEGDDGPVWFWIGSHADYDRIIRPACGRAKADFATVSEARRPSRNANSPHPIGM